MKILIANRSEIASRIIFTCKSLDIKTTCIYTKEDQFLPYVYQADESIALKNSGYQAYLDQNQIIKIAIDYQVDAIHPGYGFLSENATFAQKVIESGIIWLGPNPKCIKSMGDKILAKKIMAKNNVPTIPGFYISKDDSLEKIQEKVNLIGFPILLKDPLGGGGKGIKKANNTLELKDILLTLKSEIQKLTGSKNIVLEKYIEHGRHIEVQIAGDGQNFVHFYERECSIQRRHQKIIEETPCSFINPHILENMYQTAIKAASAINYDNIGTIEFIITPDQNFYFLEMNTRLQVEHSVTEMTTGIDLVELQIELATTKKLQLKQKDIQRKNHSLECRIYAEDPQNNFAPSTGKILNFQIPEGPFTRFDHNLEEGQTITPHFDAMIAKITTVGKDRALAIKYMVHNLNNLKIDGIKTNIFFLQSLLNSSEFLAGQIHTQLLDEIFLKKLSSKDQTDITLSEKEIYLITSVIFFKKNNEQNQIKFKKKPNNWEKQKWM